MPNTVKVSIFMSVYNTDFKMIKRAIDSVLNQDFQDFELIIVDDGSDSEGQMELLDYVRLHQKKLSYVWHANRKQSNSINKVVTLAEGEYITIIDSDDEYLPNHLSSCLQEIKFADLIASTTMTVVDTESDFYVPCKDNKDKLVHVDDCILFATLFGKKEVFAALSFQDIYSADSHFYNKASELYFVSKVDLRTYKYYRNNRNSVCAKLKIERALN